MSDRKHILNGLPVIEVDSMVFGPPVTRQVIEIEGAEKVRLGAEPELGEHTRRVLESLGYSKERIQDCLNRGVIFQK